MMNEKRPANHPVALFGTRMQQGQQWRGLRCNRGDGEAIADRDLEIAVQGALVSNCKARFFVKVTAKVGAQEVLILVDGPRAGGKEAPTSKKRAIEMAVEVQLGTN